MKKYILMLLIFAPCFGGSAVAQEKECVESNTYKKEWSESGLKAGCAAGSVCLSLIEPTAILFCWSVVCLSGAQGGFLLGWFADETFDTDECAGAVFRNRNRTDWSLVHSRDSYAEARMDAEESCNSRNNSGCTEEITFRDCARPAYTNSDKYYYWARGKSPDDAGTQALEICQKRTGKNCTLYWEGFCNSNSNYD